MLLRPIFAKIFSLKKYFAILLFIAFALRPVYSLGYVAYFQLNIDYIIETYCVNKKKPELKCNGNCHLAKQLSTSSKTETNSEGFAMLAEAFYPLYFQVQGYKDIKEQEVLKSQNNWHYNSIALEKYLVSHYHPPELRNLISA